MSEISRQARKAWDWKARDFGPSEVDDGYTFYVGVSDGGTLERAAELLKEIPGGVEKAAKRAIKRAASNMRTNAIKEIQKRYDIPTKAVREEENLSIRYNFKDDIVAYVDFAGYKIPLYRFGGTSPKRPTKDTSRRFPVMHGYKNEQGIWHLLYPSIPAHAHVLKGTAPKQFENAFVAKMSNSTGHTGIFERTGGMTERSKDEIEELFGPSVPQMVGSKESAERIASEASGKFNERFEHEISRILYGYD